MHGHATNFRNSEVAQNGASPYARARPTPHAPRSLSIRGRFDLRRSPTGPLSAWPPVPSPRAPGTPSRARIATTFPQQATRLQVNTRTGKTTPTTKKEGVHVIFVTALEHMRFLPYKHPRAEKRARARMYVRACYPAVARRGVWSASPPPAPILDADEIANLDTIEVHHTPLRPVLPLVPIGERDTRMNWRSSRATLFVRLPAGLLGDGANHKGKLTTSRNRLTLSWVHRS